MTYHRRVIAIRPVAPLFLVIALAFGVACAGGLAHPDASLFPTPSRDSITFWGHACCYIDVGGVGIVTDPVFGGVLFRHRRTPAPPPSSFALTRVVLISHAHPDHLSPETLRTFPPGTVVLCPRPSAKYLKDVGLPIRVMAPGDTLAFEGGRVIAVAAFHMGSRYGVHAAGDGGALGYVIETPTGSLYYSGDTSYFSGFADVGWTYDPDILLLNVNGHLRSTDAALAAWASRARVVIPIHWGTFGYWVVGGNDRPRDEKELVRLMGDRLHVIEVGQSFALDRASRYNAARSDSSPRASAVDSLR